MNFLYPIPHSYHITRINYLFGAKLENSAVQAQRFLLERGITTTIYLISSRNTSVTTEREKSTSVQSCESVMSVVFNCGFARVAVKESWLKVGTNSIETDLDERWKNYLGAFEDGSDREIFAVE